MLSKDVQGLQYQMLEISNLLHSVDYDDETTEGVKTKKESKNPDTTQGEQHVEPENEESVMILHTSEEKKKEAEIVNVADSIDSDDFDTQPLSKKFKISPSIPDIINSTPLISPSIPDIIKPTPLSLILLELPIKDKSKGKEVAKDESMLEITSLLEEGGSTQKTLNLKDFSSQRKTMTIKEATAQLKEIQRLANLKKAKEESEKQLKRKLSQATIKAQEQKWQEHEAKKAKMLDDYMGIFTRSNDLPITKISCTIDAQKILTMRITRDHDPLNLTVLNNFRLKMIGFSEWIEVHTLASKQKGKSYNALLQSLMAKFQWVVNQAKKVGLPPPLELATFGMSAEDKKQKRIKFLKEMFVTEDIRMDKMNRNLTPPIGIIPIDRLVIAEPESRIFFMNKNTDVAF
ncbi:hypothetical protein Tco_1089617 [Tanacetum coccineum]